MIKLNKKGEYSLVGFLIALVVIAMFVGYLGSFVVEMESKFSPSGSGNLSLSKYDQTNKILEQTRQIRNETDIRQDVNPLDVIGGYFSKGYSAIKISFQSFDLFESLMEDTSQDVPLMNQFGFKEYLITIVLILFFVGILLAVLLKWVV